MTRARLGVVRSVGCALVLGGVLSVVAAPAAAQSLNDVGELARDGRVGAARVALTDWWDASWESASREQRQEALWYRAVLTLDPAQAATQFRRLAIEYPGGAWTAQALLRLARTALLEDDLLTAARYFEDLRRDYPASAARLEAVEWLDENADRVERARSAPAASAPAPATPVATPPPTGTTSAPPTGTTTPPPAGTTSAPQTGTEVRRNWGVQLGAFSTVERARDLAARAEAAGFETRLVRIPGSDLVRLRVGKYEDAAGAEAAYDRVVAAGFDAAVVQDVSSEVPIG